MARSGPVSPPADGRSTARVLRPLAAGLLVLAALRVLGGLRHDLAKGGNAWKQGDWLIHLGAGPVRRGPFGSAVLWISDVAGLDPVATAAGLQALLLVMLVALVLRAVWRHLDHPAIAVLWLSPGVFALFWAGDLQGSLRKELIAFLALALVVAAQVRPRPRLAALVLAAAVFLVAVLGHEGNALLAPLFVLVLALALHQRGSGRALRLALPAAVLAGTAGLAVFAALHPTLPDVTLLCEPHREGGPPRWFCKIAAMDRLTAEVAGERVRVQKLTIAPVLAGFALTYALAAAPVLYALACCRRRRLLLALFVLTGLACAPLYAIGTDWGRWLDLHLTGFAFALTSLLAAGWIGPLRPARRVAALVLLVLGLLWSPAHDLGIQGPVQKTPAGPWLDGATWRGTPEQPRPGPGRTGQGEPRSR